MVLVLCTYDSQSVLRRNEYFCQWYSKIIEISSILISSLPNLQTSHDICINSRKCIAKTQILQIHLPWAVKRSPEGFTIFSFHRAFVASRKWQTNCHVGKHEVSCLWRKMIQTLSKTLGIWLSLASENGLRSLCRLLLESTQGVLASSSRHHQ